MSTTVHKINRFHAHFQLKSIQKVEIKSFSEQLVQRSKKNSQPTKINWTLSLIMDFILNGKDQENRSGGIACVTKI